MTNELQLWETDNGMQYARKTDNLRAADVKVSSNLFVFCLHRYSLPVLCRHLARLKSVGHSHTY